MDNDRKHSFYDKWSKTHYEHLTEDELKTLWKDYRKARYLEHEQYMSREILFSDLEELETPLDSYLVDQETNVEQEVLAKVTVEDMLSVLTKREREVMIVGGKVNLPPHGKEFFHAAVSSFLHLSVRTFLHNTVRTFLHCPVTTFFEGW